MCVRAIEGGGGNGHIREKGNSSSDHIEVVGWVMGGREGYEGTWRRWIMNTGILTGVAWFFGSYRGGGPGDGGLAPGRSL